MDNHDWKKKSIKYRSKEKEEEERTKKWTSVTDEGGGVVV